MVSSLLPLAVFDLTNTVFHCRLLSLLSCAMTASSLHLAVLGTHPLVNSFVAPFVVLGLSLCSRSHSYICMSNSINDVDRRPEDSPCSDENENLLKMSGKGHSSTHIGNDTASKYRTNNEHITCKEAPSVMKNNGHKQQSTITGTGLSCIVQESTALDFCWRAYLGGIIIGFASYVRPDLSLFVAIVYLSLSLGTDTVWIGSLKTCLSIVCGALSSVSICMADDFRRYGYFVLSPVHWFKFNVMSSKAGKLFSAGNSNTFTDIIWMDKLNFVIFFLVLVTSTMFSFFRSMRITGSRLFCALVMAFFTLIFTYSITGHMEPRIIHNVFILQSIISAMSIHDIVSLFHTFGVKRSHIRQSMLILFTISVIHSYQYFPSVDSHTAPDWSYKDPEQSRDINSCLNFLREQSDVKGVLVNASVYNFGGYSVLEHDVPILVQVHYEYHLYEAKDHNRLGENNGIRVFTDFSDFIDIENQPYVRKLCYDEHINYIVTQSESDVEFRTMGYENAYTSGKYSVLRKMKDRKMEVNHLREYTIDDTSILEYEANWLITNALYSKAIWRLNTAFEANRKLHLRPRVRLFQLLLVCYSKLNEWDKVKSTRNKCFALYGRETCLKQQDKIVRHIEYQQFD